MKALTDDMKMSVHEFLEMAPVRTHYEVQMNPETIADIYFPDRDQIQDYGYPTIRFHGLKLVLVADDRLLYVAQMDTDKDIVNCGAFWIMDPEAVEYLMMQDPVE